MTYKGETYASSTKSRTQVRRRVSASMDEGTLATFAGDPGQKSSDARLESLMGERRTYAGAKVVRSATSSARRAVCSP